ncbi:Transcriptional regulator, PadR family [Labilithrix luteola]|uniref:Transcriptional regulator, PadR family n=1 Tax=Labilithrix luteola TaxID=1391654 RepID=A0A0K1PXV2_9BACT|nr:PadR family transcriptional regulator [Labilithrix luteola]AKU98337.1 Transcriptional regulator, PadR family [Labilithrix luteola]
MPLLGLLLEAPAHPYELTTRLQQRYGAEMARRSSVTTLVGSLAEAGLIAARRAERVDKRPLRTPYRLTAKGTSELRRRIEEQVLRSPAGSTQLTTSLAYIGLLSREIAASTLRTRSARLRREKDALPEMVDGIAEIHMIEVAYWRTMLTAEIRWLDTLERRIGTDDIDWPGARKGEVLE